MKTAPKTAYFINGGWVLNQDEPSFVTMALVIECKKLAPEALKQRRASERFKMTAKTQLYVPHVFVTIALVIERKKLAPEARKQRRAYEKPKMTSKSQLYVFPCFWSMSPW